MSSNIIDVKPVFSITVVKEGRRHEMCRDVAKQALKTYAYAYSDKGLMSYYTYIQEHMMEHFTDTYLDAYDTCIHTHDDPDD